MKQKLLILLSASCLLLGACATKGNNDEPKKEDEQVEPSEEEGKDLQPEQTKVDYHLKFYAALTYDGDNKPLEFNYDISYETFPISQPGTAFSKDLAVLSFALTMNTSKELITSAYQEIGFDNIVTSADYDVPETKESVLFTLAHRKINEVDVISLTIIGVGYKLPWESNFIIDESGNHAGFQAGANKVLEGLNQYLTNYPDVNNRKIWINGYSRTAAIGNIVAYTLIDEELVKEENLYAYLFETPRGVDVSNTKEYKSVFNIINSGDVVTYVAPEIYGLKRVGVDINIYKENADEIVSNFDRRIILNTLTPDGDNYTNEVELIGYLFAQLTHEFSDPEQELYDLSTRANFANYYQRYIGYLLSLVFSLKTETLSAIQEAFSNLGLLDMLKFLEEDGIYDFLKPILDEHEEQYDDELLRASLNKLLTVVTNVPTIVALAMIEEARNSLVRCVQLHAPETIFPLLLAYSQEE